MTRRNIIGFQGFISNEFPAFVGALVERCTEGSGKGIRLRNTITLQCSNLYKCLESSREALSNSDCETVTFFDSEWVAQHVDLESQLFAIIIHEENGGMFDVPDGGRQLGCKVLHPRIASPSGQTFALKACVFTQFSLFEKARNKFCQNILVRLGQMSISSLAGNEFVQRLVRIGLILTPRSPQILAVSHFLSKRQQRADMMHRALLHDDRQALRDYEAACEDLSANVSPHAISLRWSGGDIADDYGRVSMEHFEQILSDLRFAWNGVRDGVATAFGTHGAANDITPKLLQKAGSLIIELTPQDADGEGDSGGLAQLSKTRAVFRRFARVLENGADGELAKLPKNTQKSFLSLAEPVDGSRLEFWVGDSDSRSERKFQEIGFGDGLNTSSEPSMDEDVCRTDIVCIGVIQGVFDDTTKLEFRVDSNRPKLRSTATDATVIADAHRLMYYPAVIQLTLIDTLDADKRPTKREWQVRSVAPLQALRNAESLYICSVVALGAVRRLDMLESVKFSVSVLKSKKLNKKDVILTTGDERTEWFKELENLSGPIELAAIGEYIRQPESVRRPVELQRILEVFQRTGAQKLSLGEIHARTGEIFHGVEMRTQNILRAIRKHPMLLSELDGNKFGFSKEQSLVPKIWKAAARRQV